MEEVCPGAESFSFSRHLFIMAWVSRVATALRLSCARFPRQRPLPRSYGILSTRIGIDLPIRHKNQAQWPQSYPEHCLTHAQTALDETGKKSASDRGMAGGRHCPLNRRSASRGHILGTLTGD